MALRSNFEGVLKIDNTSGTLVDISATVETAEVVYGIQSGTWNGLNSGWIKTAVGPRSVTISGTVVSSTGATDAYALLKYHAENAAEFSVEFFDPDETTGSLKMAFEGVVTAFTAASKNGNSGEPSKLAFTIASSGDVTISTVAGA